VDPSRSEHIGPESSCPATEERILKALNEPPPAGYSRWNGRLLAEHLGQVSKGSGLAGNAKAACESGSPTEMVCKHPIRSSAAKRLMWLGSI
jgi:hypothetical protein